MRLNSYKNLRVEDLEEHHYRVSRIGLKQKEFLIKNNIQFAKVMIGWKRSGRYHSPNFSGYAIDFQGDSQKFQDYLKLAPKVVTKEQKELIRKNKLEKIEKVVSWYEEELRRVYPKLGDRSKQISRHISRKVCNKKFPVELFKDDILSWLKLYENKYFDFVKNGMIKEEAEILAQETILDFLEN